MTMIQGSHHHVQPSALSVFMKELKANSSYVHLVNDNPRSNCAILLSTTKSGKDATEKAIQRWEPIDSQRMSVSSNTIISGGRNAAVASAIRLGPLYPSFGRSSSAEYFHPPFKPERLQSPGGWNTRSNMDTQSMDGGAPFKPQRRMSADFDEASHRSMFAGDHEARSSPPLIPDYSDTLRMVHAKFSPEEKQDGTTKRAGVASMKMSARPLLPERLDAPFDAPSFPRRKQSVDWTEDELASIGM